MRKALSMIMVLAMVLSMIPAVYAETAEPVIITTGTNIGATVAAPASYEWTASANGTLTVTISAASGGWRFVIYDGAGNTIGLPKKGTAEDSIDYELVAGTNYTFEATGYDAANWTAADGVISYTLSFVASADAGSGEIKKADYEVSDSALVLGDNSLTLLETAVTTIYVYEPTETGVFTFTAPEGAILGYWGAGSWFLSNPNSTTNTYEWTCTGVGQSAYIGVSGVDGSFNLNVEKTGDYTVVETPIVAYENKATLTPFTLPEGAQLHGYINVQAESTHTAVLGEDGYYHFNSADGDIILVDMNYQNIILSDALKSDRPVMYVYDTDEDGKQVKYDIGAAVQAYETVMDADGYYPLTEDLIYFYDNYANSAGIYTFHVTSAYNSDNVWMYCMRTVTFPEVTEPTEPEPTEPDVSEPDPTEPEPTEPDVTEPDPTEPEATEPVVTEPVTVPAGAELITSGTDVAASADEPITYSWSATADGTLTVSMGAASPGWRFWINDSIGNTLGLPKSGNAASAIDYKVTSGTTYIITIVGWDSAAQDEVATNITYAIGFTASKDDSGDVELVEKEVSTVSLVAGDNTLSLSENAVYTLYKFKPTEAGNYVFTAPEGAIVGYWGATTNYLVDPNSTTNTCQWNCSSVGQSAYIGITGVEGSFVLNIALDTITEPDPTEPEVTEPEATEPDPSEPETSEPEPSEPETSEPEPSEPEATEPAGDVISVTTSSELTQAISSAPANAIIMLQADIDLGTSTLTIPEGCNVILDLNGHTLTTKKNSGGTVTVNGTLTIQDTSAEGDGLITNTATSSDRGIVVSGSSALLTLKSGSISTQTQCIRVESGTFNCEGGTITATNYGVYTSSGATTNITGGYINSGFDIFNSTVYAPTGSNVSISGGYFNGSAPNGNGLTGNISGGYFARKVNNTALLADDCYYEDNLDTTYLFIVVNPNALPEDPEVPDVPEVVKPVHRWNLVLDDDLKVNFYMNISADDVANAKVQIAVGDNTITYTPDQMVTTEDGKYIASVSVAAAQMMDQITVQIIGTDAETEAVSYTIRQYADIVLSDSNRSQYHALIKEMLNYGAAAQTYFEYNTDNLANANITDVAAEKIPETSDNKLVITNTISGISPYGASLLYKDKITVRFYFNVTDDIQNYSFSANGTPCTAVKNGDYYTVDIDNICPQDLDKQVTITVADENGTVQTISYGPMNYIVRMNANGSDNLKALLKALYNYHLAAKLLRAN